MASFPARMKAIWKKRCPRCLEGPIYRAGMNMFDQCPVCDLVYEREQGYFMGALYISYGMASFILGLGTLLIHLVLPEWDLGYVILIVGVLFLPFVPATTRYSRILWIHFDRWAWPDQSDCDNGEKP